MLIHLVIHPQQVEGLLMALVLRYKGGSKKKGLVVEEEEVEVFIEDSAILTSGPNRR